MVSSLKPAPPYGLGTQPAPLGGLPRLGLSLSALPIHFNQGPSVPLFNFYSNVYYPASPAHCPPPPAPMGLGVGPRVLGTVRGRLQFESCKSNYRLWRKTRKTRKFASLSAVWIAGICRKIGKLPLNAPWLYIHVSEKIISIASLEQEIWSIICVGMLYSRTPGLFSPYFCHKFNCVIAVTYRIYLYKPFCNFSRLKNCLFGHVLLLTFQIRNFPVYYEAEWFWM